MRVLIFSKTVVWNISHSKKNWRRCEWKMYLHVQYVLFLSNFNETIILPTGLRKILKYQVSWKSVQWGPSCSMWTDGWTSDSHFSTLCGREQKFYVLPIQNVVVICMALRTNTNYSLYCINLLVSITEAECLLHGTNRIFKCMQLWLPSVFLPAVMTSMYCLQDIRSPSLLVLKGLMHKFNIPLQYPNCPHIQFNAMQALIVMKKMLLLTSRWIIYLGNQKTAHAHHYISLLSDPYSHFLLLNTRAIQ